MALEDAVAYLVALALPVWFLIAWREAAKRGRGQVDSDGLGTAPTSTEIANRKGGTARRLPGKAA